MKNYWIFLILLNLIFISYSKPFENSKTLVLLDDLSEKYLFSNFFNFLEENGYELDFHTPNDPSLSFKKFGKFTYNQLIIFSPRFEEPTIEVSTIVDFIDDGHDVIIGLSSESSDELNNLANQCGIQLDGEGTAVIDHFSFHEPLDKSMHHTTIIAKDFIDSKVMLGKYDPKEMAPVIFKGIGMKINQESNLLFKVLTGSPSSYSFYIDESIEDEELFTVGTKTSLVLALQTRKGSRVLFSGSREMFSDEFFDSNIGSQKSGNQIFCQEISLWTFRERGYIQVKEFTHHKLGEAEPQKFYVVLETMETYISLVEWNGNEWVSFEPNDLQLEFIMLDPYVRTTMKFDEKLQLFSTSFQVPNRHGIYKLLVEYQRVGYNLIHQEEILPVTPYADQSAHQFLTCSLPYYSGSISMLVGFLLFSLLLLYYKVDPK
ncbi:dolichyl-diphosphooligosaccharide--protein glycosyltransferase 48 kda subunit [Anaeramoeba ignava]|uniref:Dolichyl-diphosphooligosaccharide--protein glycosyltransferase 48 kDa subunit n=1 Tax=Anaeramoeba ignava TaxID=1746090 RepID=A0A9Q0LDP6_ANAIG|nr:dolichyl-diphosphooligosaccharide--protein glycosyltransferase 48 kda subunit [Anaeramoeba ignava]